MSDKGPFRNKTDKDPMQVYEFNDHENQISPLIHEDSPSEEKRINWLMSWVNKAAWFKWWVKHRAKVYAAIFVVVGALGGNVDRVTNLFTATTDIIDPSKTAQAEFESAVKDMQKYQKQLSGLAEEISALREELSQKTIKTDGTGIVVPHDFKIRRNGKEVE